VPRRVRKAKGTMWTAEELLIVRNAVLDNLTNRQITMLLQGRCGAPPPRVALVLCLSPRGICACVCVPVYPCS
jgi:hypothetical protein